MKLSHSIEIQFLFLWSSAVSLSLSAQPARFRFSELFEKATFVLFASAASIFSAPRTGLFMHVGRFLCQRGRGSLGSCLRLGIRIVCVIGARTVVAVIGAATGTFVAVVVGDGMVGARVGTLALAPGLAFVSMDLAPLRVPSPMIASNAINC